MTGLQLCRLQLLGSLFTFGLLTTVLDLLEIVGNTSPFYDVSTLHKGTPD